MPSADRKHKSRHDTDLSGFLYSCRGELLGAWPGSGYKEQCNEELLCQSLQRCGQQEVQGMHLYL